MPTKCEECGEKAYCIYITRDHKKLCEKCYDASGNKKECGFDPGDLPHRNVLG